MINSQSFHPNYSAEFEADANINPTHKEGQVRNIIIADPGIYFELTLPEYSQEDLNMVDRILVNIGLTDPKAGKQYGTNIAFLKPSGYNLVPSQDTYKVLLPFPDPAFSKQRSLDYQITVTPGAGTLVSVFRGTASTGGGEASLVQNKVFNYQSGSVVAGTPNLFSPSETMKMAITDILVNKEGVGFKVLWSDDLAQRMTILNTYLSVDGAEIGYVQFGPAAGSILADRPAVFWFPFPPYDDPIKAKGKEVKIWLQTSFGNGYVNNGGAVSGMINQTSENFYPGSVSIFTV